MKRESYKKYLLLGGALFFLISLPTLFVERVRGTAIGMLFKTFKAVSWVTANKMNESERFEGENHLLRIEIGKLRALLEQREKTAALQLELKGYEPGQLRYEQSGFLLGLQNRAIPARVIYRDPGSWSSSLWINVGQETNRLLNREAVVKNSPVIVGRSIVGAIDYVGKKQSRVRLITDVALKPSVRAVRGHPQNSLLIEHIEPILRQLSTRTDMPLTSEEKNLLSTYLEKLRGKLAEESEGHYLAKGILQGAGTPLWRSVTHTLRGIGFNYDFADEEGPARELATGRPVGSENRTIPLPIIKVNDLLVTTGIDGVFPPGLRVAEVTKIFPLREGAYTYEIEAVPVVGNLDTLQTVFIIPSLSFENEER
jgi:rod shape-determining protein MreC